MPSLGQLFNSLGLLATHRHKELGNGRHGLAAKPGGSVAAAEEPVRCLPLVDGRCLNSVYSGSQEFELLIIAPSELCS